MRFVLTILILLFSIPNLTALEPELFSNANFTLNEKSPNFFEYNGEVYVVGDDGTHGVELMKIDTLGNKLELVIDINEEGDSNPFILTKLGDKFIFNTRNDNKSSRKFWSTDGTEEGTILLFEVESSWSNEYLASTMITRNNELFLHLPGEGFGDNIWVTDGTVENSKKVNEDTEEIKILSMVKINGRIILLGDNGAFENNYALWSFDTDNEPVKLRSIKPKRGSVAGFDSWYRKTDELFFFKTYNEENEESTDLWATDGAKNGIVKLATFDSEHEINFSHRTRNFTLNDNLYFVTSYNEGYDISGIWVSDGTTEGTFDLKEIGINTDNMQDVEFIGSVNDRLVINLTENNSYKETIWSTDGFANGTYKLSGINIVRFNPWSNKEIENHLYYVSGTNNNNSIWKTDGTPGSTTKIIDIPKNQHSDSYYSQMYEFINNNNIYFSSHFEKNYDLYSLNIDTEELELLHSSQDGGVSDMDFHDGVTYMLYSNKEKKTMHYNFVGNTEEINQKNKTNSKPYDDLELQLSGNYIYFFADYEGDESYQLYRFENPASGISSVEDYESNQVNFYPNPTSNNLTLELEEMTDISIVDINGNQVLSFSDFTGGVIDLSVLASGFYSITNSTGKLIGKFIKSD